MFTTTPFPSPVLDGYVGSLEVKIEQERRILFHKGLSMGLKLAALGW